MTYTGSLPTSDDRFRHLTRFLCEASAPTRLAATPQMLSERIAQVSVNRFCAVCAVHLLDAEGAPIPAAIADEREERKPSTEEAFDAFLRADDGLVREAVQSRQPQLFMQGLGDRIALRHGVTTLLDATSTRSLLVVPLLTDSSVMGTLSFLSSRHRGRGRTSPPDLGCALAVARQLSLALENLSYREQERCVAARQRFLARATDQLFAAADKSELLRLLVIETVEAFADCSVAISLSDGKLHMIAKAGFDSRLLTAPVFTSDAERAILAAMHGQQPLLMQYPAASPFAHAAGTDANRHAWMMAPLLMGSGNVGGVVCSSAEHRYEYNDLEIFRELSRRTSLALEHAASFERERRLTQTLQRATLPARLADVPGARLTAAYFPAAKKEQVGGDWYDAFPISEDRILITVGDVTGHGLEASMVMGELRHALNVVAMYEADPARILDMAEQILLRRYPDGIATAFLAIIDPAKNTITYANAGHPWPIVRLRDGTVHRLTSGGVPLGVRHMRPPESCLTANLGDIELILFYTDGITDATRDTIEGERRLENAVGCKAVSLVKNAADFVRGACMTAAARDDVALLALNFLTLERWDFDSSDQRAGQEARRDFSNRLRDKGVRLDDCVAAELVFGELAANVARHAPGPVEVALEWRGSQPVLHVIDRGSDYAALKPSMSISSRKTAVACGWCGVWAAT